MQLITFHLNGFWYYVTFDTKYNVGKDKSGSIWYFKNGKIINADNEEMFTKNYYSEPIKKIA